MTVKSVIVMLDQLVGELHNGGNGSVGVELWPEIVGAFENLIRKGCVVTLVLPQPLSESELRSISKSLLPVRVLAEESIVELTKKLRIGKLGESVVFVSADRVKRKSAMSNGLSPVPHVIVAQWMLENQKVHFAEIASLRKPFSKTINLLPYHVKKKSEFWIVTGLATTSALLQMINEGASVSLLPFDYRTCDCAFLQVDLPHKLKADDLNGIVFLASSDGRLLVSLDKVDPSSLLSAAHGPLEILFPSPELLVPTEDPDGFTKRSIGLSLALKDSNDALVDFQVPPMASAQAFFSFPSAATFETDAKRYSGQLPVGASTIVSRHVKHPDNPKTVAALADELVALGLCVYNNSFSYNGQTLNNVIADIPGKGYYIINKKIFEKLLTNLWRHPYPWSRAIIERELRRVLGHTQANYLLSKLKLLGFKVEDAVGIYRWLPWWKLRNCVVGLGAQIVIVGCHLDSSADRSQGYNPATDPAPGMDDNASGISACLAAARYLALFNGQLIHTVRFCFFNGEEQGLLGSKAYAASLKAKGAPVKAVICADMIGYNSDANSIFEIHAGYPDPGIRDSCLPIASKVQAWAASISTLQPAQIYKGTSTTSGAPDRNLYDPAINRSDHGSFQQQGYAAIAVTEDYFANLPSEPNKDPNPNYHTALDKIIDSTYGASIANAIACAVKELANT